MLRPPKAFQAAWIATGYFSSEHFEGSPQITHEEAKDLLDETGMLAAMNLPSDHVGEPMKANRPGVGVAFFCM